MRKMLAILVCVCGTGFLMGLSGCSKDKKDEPERKASSDSLTPGQRTGAIKLNFDHLKRQPGQTEFLSLETLTFRDGRESGAPTRGDLGGGPREVQESDIFKVAPGKMLYLLNSYRGLQAISFAKGEEQGELLGRVFPETRGIFRDMYLDSKKSIVYVLSSSWAPETTRVTAYDVENPARMVATDEAVLEGTLADSRLVGDVLYVATRAESEEGGARGLVSSLRLRGGITKLDARSLAMVPDSDESMNIVEVKEGPSFRYYLLAHLADSGWGLGRKGAVEVVDISSSDGKIKSVMNVRTAGSIERRSSTMIKGGALLVVSNAFTEEQDEEVRRLQIAVEVFALPGAKSKIILPAEEARRRARLETELRRIERTTPDPAERAAKNDAALANPDYGLVGVFVKDADGLRKGVADRKTTIAADGGGHAQVKDVRWNGEQLYIFWMPLNRVDPFDVFDVAHPLNGTPHRARLEFEGWVERAIAISYSGRDYVIGLGWIEAEGDERHIQAKLFEVERTGSGVMLSERATLKLDSPQIFSNFATGAKFIEVNFKTPSSGEILFEASALEGGVLREGGKLLTFDLAKAEGALAEGPMLLGEGAWLRRVFTNPELNRVQAFSDEALVTFAAGARTAEAVQVIELARNIVAHIEIPFAGATAGVQVVSRAAWVPTNSGWTSGGSVELRLTHGYQPDAEASEVLSTLKLEGGFYAEHAVVDGRILIITESSSFDESEARGRAVKRLYLVVAKDTGLALVDSKEITEETGRSAPPLTVVGRSMLKQGREIWLATGTNFYNVTIGGGIAFAAIEMDSCRFGPEAEVSLVNAGERPALFVRERVEASEPPFVEPASARVTKNFVVPFAKKNTRTFCGERVNIPGEPVLYSENFVVSKDDEYKGFEAVESESDGEKRTFYDINSAPALTVTKLSKVATLTDLSPDERVDEVVPAGEYLLRLKRVEGAPSTEAEIIGVDAGKLTRKSQWLKLAMDVPVIGPVFPMNETKQGVFITNIWTEEGALFGFESGELKSIPLRASGKPAREKVFLPGLSPKVLYDFDAKSLVISSGLYGNFLYYE